MGLRSTVTGRSHVPGCLRGLRRQEAETPTDQRVLGMSLTLLTLAVAQSSGGHVPIAGLCLVTLVAFEASMACTFASLFIGGRARCREVPRAEAGRPELPLD